MIIGEQIVQYLTAHPVADSPNWSALKRTLFRGRPPRPHHFTSRKFRARTRRRYYRSEIGRLMRRPVGELTGEEIRMCDAVWFFGEFEE